MRVAGNALFLGLLGWAAMSRPAAAQDAEPSDVVLLAPEAVRADWAAALQIELAPRGARVIPLDPVATDTVLLGDAEAQRLAREHGARAAARVVEDASGLTMRVIDRDASAARVVPLAREADARTVALIVVSMLDEPAPASTATAVPATPLVATALEASADVAVPPPATGAAEADAEPAAETVEEPSGTRLRWSGRIGSGGFALINDRRFIPGAMLRGGLGLRFGWWESALLADVAVMIDQLADQGTEIQPLGRLCLETGAAFPLGKPALHVGGRGCVGFAELRRQEFFDPFGGSFAVDHLGWLGSGGGYLGISFGLSDTTRLFIRTDVEYMRLESSDNAGEVFVGLSVLLSFG